MVALAGEASVFLKDKLSKTAKELVENKKFEKYLDEAVKDPENLLTKEGKNKILKEISEIAGLDIDVNFKGYLDFRAKFIHNVGETTRLWKLKSFKAITETEIVDLFSRHLEEFPGLVKGHNQADFSIKFYKNGKQFDEVTEFSLSGYKQKILDRFGNPPKLPANTIDIFENYDEFTKFVTGAYDLTGRPRKYDSEIKFVYNFLKNHINKADEFVIETSNIFATCTSCSREFVMLEEYLKTLGKKVKFVIRTDETIEGFGDLRKRYKSIDELTKRYERIYKKQKRNK